MLVDDTAEKDGHGLAQGHDNGKDDRSKRADGEIDEQLANGRTNREQKTVVDEGWMLGGKL